jgi:hypothetical protein
MVATESSSVAPWLQLATEFFSVATEFSLIAYWVQLKFSL